MDLSPRLFGAQRAAGCLEYYINIIRNDSAPLNRSREPATPGTNLGPFFHALRTFFLENESIFHESAHLPGWLF